MALCAAAFKAARSSGWIICLHCSSCMRSGVPVRPTNAAKPSENDNISVGISVCQIPNAAAFSAIAMRSALSRSFSSARSRSMAFPARCAPASTTPQVAVVRRGGLLVIHGERSEHLLLGIADGHAPASSQTEAQDEVSGGSKAVIVGDVFDNRGFVAESRRTASAHFGADYEPVHALHIRGRQPSSRPLPQLLPLFVQQEHRAIAIRGHALNCGGQGVQDLL